VCARRKLGNYIQLSSKGAIMFKLEEKAICPQCEKGILFKTRRDLEFKYKEKYSVFKQEEVFKCNLCGYEGLNKEAAKRIEKELTKFRLSVKKEIDKKSLRNALGYMIDVMSDYDGYDVNNAKSLKELIDKMVKFAKRKLKENKE
jgi:YgiT-type zinc finger domain-containing protein